MTTKEKEREHYIVKELRKPERAEFTKPLSAWQRVSSHRAARKLFVIASLMCLWEIIARVMAWKLDNGGLLLPTFLDTAQAFWDSAVHGQHELLRSAWETVKALLTGFALGSVAASALVVFAVNKKIGEDYLSTICALISTLPAIAVLPLAQTWLGISWSAIVAVTYFATVSPIALSMYQGFRAVPPTLRNVGRNMGLTGLSFTARILIPAALPSIMTGLRNGMSNAFRALVATEMVMGVASGGGGLGWMVFSAKQNLEMPTVFAGILTIMILGLCFEGLFLLAERLTVKRWGMIR